MLLSMYGCTEIQVKYLPIDLTQKLPEKSILPVVKKEELRCLTDDVYKRLEYRQWLLKKDSLTCRALIETTKKAE